MSFHESTVLECQVRRQPSKLISGSNDSASLVSMVVKRMHVDDSWYGATVARGPHMRTSMFRIQSLGSEQANSTEVIGSLIAVASAWRRPNKACMYEVEDLHCANMRPCHAVTAERPHFIVINISIVRSISMVASLSLITSISMVISIIGPKLRHTERFC